MATEAELAYMAGIFDGEGCIRINRDNLPQYRGGKRYELRVSITSTDEWLCKYFRENWGGYIHCEIKPFRKSFWRWALVARQSMLFLEALLPYLHIKLAQAELALQFQKIKKYPRTHNKTEQELALEESQYITMRKLKRQIA